MPGAARQAPAAGGVAVNGAFSTAAWGAVVSRGGSVSAMVLAMVLEAVIVLAAAGLTLLLPRRAARRRAAVPRERTAEERTAEYSTEARG